MKKKSFLFLMILTLLVPLYSFFASAEEAEMEYIPCPEFAGKRIGILTGSVFDEVADHCIPDCVKVYYNTSADAAIALSAGKIDAYLTDEPVARVMQAEYPEQKIAARVSREPYGFVFAKNSGKGQNLAEQMDAFLRKCREDGTLQELESVWFGSDESLKTVDMSDLRGENGTLVLSVTTEIGVPFVFLKDGALVGYDVDAAVRFCRAYGYGIKIRDGSFSSLLADVGTGKSDFGVSCISITEERKQSVLFSDPYYVGGSVIVVFDAGKAVNIEKQSFLTSLRGSFEKTFLRESRWKLFAGGILTTLFITLLSALLGTAIGFAVFLFYRHNRRIPNRIVNVFLTVFQNTPVVVILMVLYYIVFGKTNLSADWVAVIGFTLLFAASVIGLLKVGVGAVDRGQTEAALALGYTESQAFLRMVLPQAAGHFMPGFRSELVSLIKGTAVVGYISVQDLTKVGDIVRSRTLEAFFPLIATAVLYFLLAWGLTALVSRVEFRLDPARKDRSKFLKGVQTK